jgi:Sec-independent protein secretion pathway component TatC
MSNELQSTWRIIFIFILVIGITLTVLYGFVNTIQQIPFYMFDLGRYTQYAGMI